MRHLLLAFLLAAPLSSAWPRAGGGGDGGYDSGGCFPAGTKISTIEGDRPIQEIRPGDKVLAYTGERLVRASVVKTYAKKSRLMVIRTTKGRLIATPEHPLLTPNGFTEVRNLKREVEVAILKEGRRVWAKITSIKPGGVAKVYNLEVAPPHTFIAGSFIVHNKGGDGSYGGYDSYGYDSDDYGSGGYGSGGYYRGGRYRSGRRSSGNNLLLALLGTFILIKTILFMSERRSSFSAANNSLLENGVVTPRAEATLDILKSLSRRDPAFSPDALESFVRAVFLRVELAWQGRDYSTLRDVMMPGLLAGHTAKVEAMKERGEINMMDDLKVLHVDFVHVSCPLEKEGRSFTALITASAADYIVSEMTERSSFRGALPATFQEFWTFNQLNGNWALARIDQVGEFDFLNAPNLPDSPQSPVAFLKAAGPAAVAAAMPPSYNPAGKTAAGLPPAAARDITGADSGQWNRQKMEIAATLAFENVYEAWGRNDSSLLKAGFVSPETLDRLKRIMEARRAEGLTFEFKNLFTRRAEIVLASPASRSKLRLDEFTARIKATAVRAMLRNGKQLHRDAAPEPFTEYWVFGRQRDDWKLRDILPRMDQEGADNTRDGAPSPVQIEWYWPH